MKTIGTKVTEILGLVIIAVLFAGGMASQAQPNIHGSNFEATAKLVNAVQYNGSLEDIRRLLEEGADANAKNSEGWPVLQLATKRDDIEIVRLLLEKGAEVNAGNNWSVTSLGSAAFRGYTDIVKLLLEKGADVNMVYKDNTTALSSAATGGYTNVMGMLLKKGADINRTNKFGYTPLMSAVGVGKTDVAKFLLASGANVNLEDGLGYTALDLASINHNAAMMEVLQHAGATRGSAVQKTEGLIANLKNLEEAEIALSNSLQNALLPGAMPPPSVSSQPVKPSFISKNNTDGAGYVTNASLLKPFTVTNSAGTVFADAVLVRLMPGRFIYKTLSGAMGTQRLDALPAAFLKKISYDPEAAKATEEAEAQKKAAEQAQAQFRRAMAAQQVAAAMPGQTAASSVTFSIRENAERKWPGDYDMQKYEIETQTKAYNWVATATSATGVPQAVFEQIKAEAQDKWPDEYDMQKYEIEKQVKAYLALH